MAAAETLLSAPTLAPAAGPRTLLPSRLANAEHARTVYRVIAEEGTTLDEILRPLYWASVAANLQRFDLIEVIADDEAWFLQLIVRDCGRGFAKVAILSKVDFDAADADKPVTLEGFSINWKGPKRRFVILRDADNTIVKEEIASKAQALAWVQDFIRSGGN